MKTSTTSKKHTRATVERSFFNLVLLNLLNIRKDYYKPQEFPLKHIKNDTVNFRSPASFLWKHFFRNISKDARFSGNSKLSIWNTFSRIFFTYLFSISNQLLINIYYLHYWFLKKRKVLCSRFFYIFQNIPVKCRSLYTRLRIILKRLHPKVIRQKFLLKEGVSLI